VRAARAVYAPLLPLPCYRCDQPVTAQQVWHVEHDPPWSRAGSRIVGVSHATCNTRHGATLGRVGKLGDQSRRWLAMSAQFFEGAEAATGIPVPVSLLVAVWPARPGLGHYGHA
jgi:hypothetical protein